MRQRERSIGTRGVGADETYLEIVVEGDKDRQGENDAHDPAENESSKRAQTLNVRDAENPNDGPPKDEEPI